MKSIRSSLCGVALLGLVLSGLMGCSGQTDFETSLVDGKGIVGGELVTENDQVSDHTVMLVNLETNEICSGVLISPKIILTAAHCLRAEKENIKAYFSNSPLEEDEDVEIGEVTEVVLHQQYSVGKDLDSVDLAMLVLAKAAPVHYQPVAMNDDEQIQIGTEVLLAGYGNSTTINSEGFGRLRKVTANISKTNGAIFFEIDQSIGLGICDGDSGGPVFKKGGDKLTLIGIAKLTYDKDGTGLESCFTTSQYTSLQGRAIKSWILDFIRKYG